MKILRIFKLNLIHQITKWDFWSPIILMLCIVIWVNEPLKYMLSKLYYNINAAYVLFMPTNIVLVVVYFLGLLVIFSRLPFKNNQQVFLVLRTGKASWIISHLIFIVFVSVLYFIIFISITLLSLFPYVYFDLESWGKVVNTFCEMPMEYSLTSIAFEKAVVVNFTPLSACAYFVFVVIIVSYLLGVIQFVFNVLSNGIAGNIIASILLFLYLFSLIASGNLYMYISPISWINFQNLNVVNKYYPSMQYTVLVVFISSLLLTIACAIIGNKKIKISLF